MSQCMKPCFVVTGVPLFFVIAVLQIKLMFNNLPHNVRVRQVNYVNSDISTALLLVLVIQQS